jgi:cell division protein FtsQ
VIGVAEPTTTARESRGGLRRSLTIGIVTVAVLVLAWLIGFSSVLGVRSVTVKGARTITAEQVREAAGIRPGTPLLRLDKAAVKRRVAALPAVRTVAVDTAYPSTVTLTVTERVAVAYRQNGGAVDLIDRDDVALRSVPVPPPGLPRLDVSGDAAKQSAAAAVAASLSGGVARKVDTITVPTTESITLKLTDGRTILWGGTDRNDEKAHLLQALLGQAGTYIDLSDPDSVISRGAPPSGN